MMDIASVCRILRGYSASIRRDYFRPKNKTYDVHVGWLPRVDNLKSEHTVKAD